MDLASLYIILGSVSFVTSAVTLGILLKKFIDQPAAHGFFVYSDTIASALLSLGLLLDGVIALVPGLVKRHCYHFKLLYGLYVVSIITSYFSVLGMAIERFQAFAVYKDHRHITRKFSIGWFLSSWTLSILFVIILLPQISEKGSVQPSRPGFKILAAGQGGFPATEYLPASNIFPGPHNQLQYESPDSGEAEPVSCAEEGEEGEVVVALAEVEALGEVVVAQVRANDRDPPTPMRARGHGQEESSCTPAKFIAEESQATHSEEQGFPRQLCQVNKQFIKYFFILLFLLCFVTPVLITVSLNVFITFAVRNTHHEAISHHQWMTLAACIVMWGPSLLVLLLSKAEIITGPNAHAVSVFLFLLGHTHNLLRSVLHVLFAQQIHTSFKLEAFRRQVTVGPGHTAPSGRVGPAPPSAGLY
jgi:hypothetical protein